MSLSSIGFTVAAVIVAIGGSFLSGYLLGVYDERGRRR